MKFLSSPLKDGMSAASIALAVLALVVLLGGCDSGTSGGGSSAPATDQARIEGNVQDVHGPVMNAKIEVRDKNGQLITSTSINNGSNHYSITVPAGTSYPILITATPPQGSNSSEVKATVTSPLADRMDVTDITTLVVESAMTLGGLTEQNIAKASGSAIGLRQRQGVSASAGGGGAGAGQSGGGVSRGGHGGHDMSGMGGGAAPSPTDGGAQSPHQQMGH